MSPPTFQHRIRTLLLRSVDLLLLAILFGVPAWMGGREAPGQLWFVALALAAGACWCLAQYFSHHGTWNWSWTELILLAAVAWAALEIVPLPPSVIRTLSGHIYELLPLWSPDTDASQRLGVWSYLSLTPVATRYGVSLLIAYAVLFVITFQRLCSLEDIQRLLRWIAIAGAAMAALGLAQYVAGNGKFFWFYQHPFSTASDVAKGSFTNRNHFAHFLILTMGPLVWWLKTNLAYNTKPSRPRWAPRRSLLRQLDRSVTCPAAALVLCSFAVLMSLSRGGMLAMAVAAAVCVMLLYRSSLLDRKTLVRLAAVGLLLVIALGIHGYQLVSSRLNDFQSIEQLDALGQRRRLWQAGLAAVADFPWTGTGIGSHVQVYPLYLADDEVSHRLRYTHAENGYLQVAIEAGIPGLLLVLGLIGLGLYWCRALLRTSGSRRSWLCFVGIAPSLAANLVHAFVDFVWYIPGCMVVVVLLTAALGRLAQMAGREGPGREGRPTRHALPVARPVWLLAACLLLFVGFLSAAQLWRHVQAESSWNRVRTMCRDLEQDDADTVHIRHLTSIAAQVKRVLMHQPDHALAHARMAQVQLQMFHYGQKQEGSDFDARQVRDAALASRFESRADLDAWLARAFGDRSHHLKLGLAHGRRAVALCPLHGESYLTLSLLTYLDAPHGPDKSQCLQQALLVRPLDGTVLFEAGTEAVLQGDLEKAVGYWKRSFRCGSLHQQRLFSVLVHQLPAESLLETFPMDIDALRRLEASYVRLGLTQQQRVVLQRRGQLASQMAGKASSPDAQRRLWTEAAGAYHQLTQTDKYLQCLQHIARLDPFDYESRFELAKALVQSGQFAQADEHIRWCLERRPHDSRLPLMLKTATRQQAQTQDR